jgi:hypothetical protein
VYRNKIDKIECELDHIKLVLNKKYEHKTTEVIINECYDYDHNYEVAVSNRLAQYSIEKLEQEKKILDERWNAMLKTENSSVYVNICFKAEYNLIIDGGTNSYFLRFPVSSHYGFVIIQQYFGRCCPQSSKFIMSI